MGLTRKLMSVSTLGAVDMRSDKERTAAYTDTLRKEARKQTKIMAQQAAEQSAHLARQERELRAEVARVASVPAPVPPAARSVEPEVREEVQAPSPERPYVLPPLTTQSANVRRAELRAQYHAQHGTSDADFWEKVNASNAASRAYRAEAKARKRDR